jgi:hypothetical protein
LKVQEKACLDARRYVCPRPMLSKKELLSVFVQRPEPGKPIILPDGHPFYLRSDLKKKYHCSNGLIRQRESLASLRPAKRGAKALERREFYLIGERRRAPKKLFAWSGRDMEAIQLGEEDEQPALAFPLGGPTPKLRQLIKERREAVGVFLKALKWHLPMRAADALALAQEQGYAPQTVNKVRQSDQTLVTKQRRYGPPPDPPCYYWCLPSQNSPAQPESDEARQDRLKLARAAIQEALATHRAATNGPATAATPNPAPARIAPNEMMEQPEQPRSPKSFGAPKRNMAIEQFIMEQWSQDPNMRPRDLLSLCKSKFSNLTKATFRTICYRLRRQKHKAGATVQFS